MKPTTLPMICGLTLAASLGAGVSHWWSVRQFVELIDRGTPNPPARMVEPVVTQMPLLAQQSPQRPAPAASMPIEEKHQKDFYEALIQKLARVETQNRDLLDQLAETNRDLMKLEFRVDTHSESFRPLPVVEEKPFTSIDGFDGEVLPPRANAVELPPN